MIVMTVKEIVECETCRLTKKRDSGEAPLWDSIIRTNYFDVVHAFNTSLLGWIVLVVRRHIESVDELTEDEASELGKLIRNVSAALRTILGCSKTYIMQFAEKQGHHHVHFHIVPRMKNMPEENKGINVFNYLGVLDEARVSEPEMNQIALKLKKRLTIK